MTTEPTRFLVITNEHAGGADDAVAADVLAVLRDGADTETAEVADVSALEDAISRADGRVPVVIGGDGSVHALVAAAHRLGLLARSDHRFVFGLIPSGTGNDLARTLGLPLDPVDAARVVLQGRRQDLDILLDDHDGVVVNAVHLGVGAEAGRRAAAWKPRLGRWAYPAGALAAGLSTDGWPIQVTVDGTVLADGQRNVLMAALGNGATIGGGAPVAPPAERDDGRVDVVVSFSTGPLARAAFAGALTRGRHPRRNDVVHRRGRVVEVSAGPVPVNADGEVSVLDDRRTWTVLHHAAQVIVPR